MTSEWAPLLIGYLIIHIRKLPSKHSRNINFLWLLCCPSDRYQDNSMSPIKARGYKSEEDFVHFFFFFFTKQPVENTYSIPHSFLISAVLLLSARQSIPNTFSYPSQFVLPKKPLSVHYSILLSGQFHTSPWLQQDPSLTIECRSPVLPIWFQVFQALVVHWYFTDTPSCRFPWKRVWTCHILLFCLCFFIFVHIIKVALLQQYFIDYKATLVHIILHPLFVNPDHHRSFPYF